MSVYDRVVPNNATETLFVLALVLLLYFIWYIFKSVRNYIIEKVGKGVRSLFRRRTFKRVLSIQSQYDVMLVGTKANFLEN